MRSHLHSVGPRTAWALPGIIVTALVMLAAAIAPAQAGQGEFITVHNDLPQSPSSPGYPRLALKGGDSLCWYPSDLAGMGPVAPAGGKSTTYTEVNDAFFSFCDPFFAPDGAGLFRWQQFRMMSQVRPNAPWETVTWGNDISKPLSVFTTAYWMVNGDPRGYHFDLDGPAPKDILVTPAGPACLKVDPLPLSNYDGQLSLTVSTAKGRKCSLTSAAPPRKVRSRTVRLEAGETRPVIVGGLSGHGTRSPVRWEVRANACTSDHFDASSVHVRRGPGASRWQVVSLTGTDPGKDTCLVDLVGQGHRTLVSQRVTVTVR